MCLPFDPLKDHVHAGKYRQTPVSAPLPVQPQGLPTEAAIILYPFTRHTKLELAVTLLLQHVAYHTQMGFTKVVQYTQVRRHR